MTIHRQPPWKQLRQQPIPTLSRGLEIGAGSVFVSPLYQKLRATWMRRSAAPVASVRTAVVAHVYYPEFWPEIVQVWRTLPAGSPLIVTTTHDRVDQIRALAGSDRLIEIHNSDNRGRDIAPFVQLLNAGQLDRFDAVLKIHTKKSPHLRGGDLRRRIFYLALAGHPGNVRRILRQFSNPAVGLVGLAAFFRSTDFYWLGNKPAVEELCRRMEPKAPVRPGFFEGAMFWARPKALAPLRTLHLRPDDFDAEAGQLNGTLHHAVERVFSLCASAAGYDTHSILGKTLLAGERRQAPVHSTFSGRKIDTMRILLRSEAARPLRRILRPLVKRAATVPLVGRCVAWGLAKRAESTTAWYAHYRSGANYAGIQCRGTVRFSVVMPIYKVQPRWLEEAIASVVGQTYPHWELICIDDGSRDASLSALLQRAEQQDARVRWVPLTRNQGVSRATNTGIEQATGDFVLFMDHDDVLEPHALARLADAAFSEDPDILYGDEVVTGENTEEIRAVQARPAFSHTYYLSHPYVVHPVAVRTALARQVGGLDVSLTISQDVDFLLRALEVASKVTHVPDILYRWRTHPGSAGHRQKAAVMRTTCALKTAHLRRIGFPDAEVRNGPSFNTFQVRYFAKPVGRILGIIPTKNQVSLLRHGLETICATTQGLDLDLVVIDHQSDDPETLAYLRGLASCGMARVLPYHGKFNFSAMNNHAVRQCGEGYDFFLFLNNDIEAINPGWLEAMLDVAMRPDVGGVGATLLYPDGKVQHAGVVVGLCGPAEHAFKTRPFGADDSGHGGSLHATREYSAVTAACMLVPAPVFHDVHGFDEELEVGFSDTDLCLRIGARGKRIINCAEAVLVHHESVSRGQSLDGRDPHPVDTSLFRSRYAGLLQSGDPHFSPLLASDDPTFVLRPSARLTPAIRYRTISNVLPGATRIAHDPRDGRVFA